MPSPYLGTLQCILQILELFVKEFLNWAQTCCCLESALFWPTISFVRPGVKDLAAQKQGTL
jgi:hypothetical protein